MRERARLILGTPQSFDLAAIVKHCSLAVSSDPLQWPAAIIRGVLDCRHARVARPPIVCRTRAPKSFGVALAFLGVFFVYGAVRTVALQNRSSSSQTVWDRVFSVEQAARGEATYLDECGRCHSETHFGGDFGPPVIGTTFWDAWKGKTAADLFDRVRTTMPQDNPGRMSATQTSELLAFLMKSNGFPAGETPLSADVAVLKSIKLEPTRGEAK